MIPLGMYFLAQPHEEGQRGFLRLSGPGLATWVAVCVHEPRKGADGQELHMYRVVAVTEDILSAETLLMSYEE
jgi:hypothetical protein